MFNIANIVTSIASSGETLLALVNIGGIGKSYSPRNRVTDYVCGGGFPGKSTMQKSPRLRFFVYPAVGAAGRPCDVTLSSRLAAKPQNRKICL